MENFRILIFEFRLEVLRGERVDEVDYMDGVDRTDDSRVQIMTGLV